MRKPIINRLEIKLNSSTSKVIIIAVVSFLVAAILFGINVFAQWWIIDDHEIMWFLGDDGRLGLSEVYPLLKETEIGHYGNYPRFRPSYYVLRLIEAVVWGDNPMLWYGFRVWIVFFFISSFWLLLSRHINYFTAGLLVIYTITYTYWIDIFCRLGPAEVYATFGVALFLLGLDSAYRNITSTPAWVAMLAGFIFASGAKENFLILLAPMIIIFGWATWKRKQSVVALITIAISIAWSFWIAGAVLNYIRDAGKDVYSQSTNIYDRFNDLFQSLHRNDLEALLAFFVFYIILWLVFRKSQPELARISKIAGGGFLTLTALYLSQAYFYNGQWPTNNRYDFPGMLYFPLAICLNLWYIQKLSHQINRLKPYRIIILAASILFGIGMVLNHIGEARFIVKSSISNWERSNKFSEKLNRLVHLSTEYPTFAIVFQTDDYLDYEPVFSYPRFLIAHSVNNPLFLLWTGRTTSGADNLEIELTRTLENLSQFGDPNYYKPQSKLDLFRKRCILVILSGDPGHVCNVQINGKWIDK